ncbi:MAG: choice-of-anchor J domain-containing protein [Bacteroidales bacterium]|nr:choice-of-anchor J domain-containing protein [Bacteroidales bacterium]
MLKKSLLLMLLMALMAPWAVAQQALPYSYGFEDNDLSTDGWTTQNPSGLNASEFGIYQNSAAAHSGSYGFRFSSYYDSGASTQYLISPQLNAPKGVVVQFYYKAYSGSGETFKVGYSTTTDDISSFTFGSQITASTAWAQTDELTFPAGTKYVAVYYYPNYKYRLFVDDFTFSNPPSCVKPTGLAATLTPGNGTIATLNWTAGGEETAWVLEYGTTSDFTGATSVNVSGTPTKNLTGLTAETKYYARVKADCGGGDTSEWSATCEFTPTNALTVTVGNETTTSSNAPIRNGSGTQSEFVYPANMLTALNGKTLTSVKFYASTTSASYTNNVTVYMQEVAGTTESTSAWLYNQSTATKVYEGTALAVADGELLITFSTPYEYAGGNLCFNVWAATSAPSVTWKGFNPGYASCGYDFSITPPVSSPYSTAQFLPKATFEFESNLYPKPKNLAVTNLTNSTATITWEAPNSDVQSYKYQYREEGGTWTDLTTTTTLSAPLTVLTGNTTYEFQVQAIYAGNNESAFASTSFNTPCDAFSIDPTAYQYGFENLSDMDCWTLTNVTNGGVGSNSWASSNLGYEPARTGTNFWAFLYVDYDDTDPEYQTLISPELTDLPANGVHVEFYYVGDMNGSGQETFRVGYSTTNKDLSSFTWGIEITDASTAYQRFSANYPQGTKYVAVQHTSDDQYYLFLDDFTFEGAADCLEPSSVLADNITTTGASINWTAGGEEVAWDIYVTDDATIVPDDGTTPTYANISTKPYPLPGLTPATTYYVYVRAACKGTEISAWSTPVTFHTECEGMDLPYGPYGFEDGTLSVCWNVINTNTSYNSVSVSASNANLGTHCLSFFRGSYDGDLVAVLPEVGAYDLSDYQFEFNAKGSYAGYEITIGIMTDPDDLTTFVAQGDVITTTTSYAEHKVRFNGYTGTGKYVAISVVRPSSVTYGSIYVDDIAINPIPSCIEPSGLTVSDETAHGATFSWTNGDSETEWHLYFSKTDTAPADDIDLKEVTVADSNPFTLTTGLDPETDYYVWVRASCGGTDGYSTWVGPETFTTDVACPAPTGFNYSEVTAHTAKLSWTGTSDSYNVWYRTAATMSNPIFSETFETSSLPTGWGRSSTALTDDVLNGTTTINSYSGGWTNTSYGLGQYNWKMNIYNTGKYWLITPSITLDAKNTLNFDAAITAYNSNNAPTSSNMANANSRFVVLITTDNQATWTILREWNNTSSADVLNNISNTGNNFSIDLTAYAGETVKIAFYGGQTASGPDCDLHIDNVVIGTPVEAGEWTKKTADASPYVATGLLAETKYEAQVQGNCGSEGTSQWTSSVFFTTDIACPAPTALAASNPTSSSFDISWNNGGAEDWIVAYKVDGAADFTELNLNVSDVTEEAGVISYTLGGLDPETDYIVKVRDNCEASVAGDGVSEWTTEVAFSTIAACSALNPVVSDITHHNATVNFEGESASGFTVKYREAEHIDGISEEFSSSSAPEGWTRYSGEWNSDGTGPTSTTTSGWTFGAKNFTNSHAYMNMYSNWKYWLVTPSITVGSNYVMIFDAAYTKYNATTTPDQTGTDDRFVILISTDNKAHWTSLREWNNAGTGDAVLNDLPVTFQPVDPIDLSAFNGQTVYIAFYGASTESNTDNHLRIDNVTIGVTVPAATTWHTQAATGTTANLTGLTAGTKYDVKVVPNCDNTLVSDVATFTTLADNLKIFITEGTWGTASNWLDNLMPTISDNVTIRANATIESGCVAEANQITFEGTPTPTLTINDGGQLYHNYNVTAKIEKTITGAPTWNPYGEDQGGWYLISNPLNNSYLTPTSGSILNLTPANISGVRQYDLYKYSESGMNWLNYYKHNSGYYLTQGIGLLYARATTATISFNGTLPVADVTPSLSFTEANGDMAGWNLLGNPFSHNITWNNMTKDKVNTSGYYRMVNGAWEAEASTDKAIAPMEGFLVKATESGATITIKNTESAKGRANDDFIKFIVSNNEFEDVTFAKFSTGEGLPKINHRNTQVPMVYIPQEGEKYAIATMGDDTEMFSLNFKAMTTGQYTLSYKAEGNYSYLHVIDRLTGEDIDMLLEGEYSFIGSPRDNEARFIVKLNYNANMTADSDIFVYQSGDELIVNGEGTLQVYDVMGRFVASYEVNGNMSINASQFSNAVYIFRMVGTDVKTQKIVVR